MKHFVTIAEHSPQQLRHLLDVSFRLKKQLKSTGRNDPLLAGKSLAMIFEKPSLRTRVSFAVGMTQLGGNGLLLREDEVGIDKREPVQDVARVISSMCDGIMARTFEQATVERLAQYSTVPEINGLSSTVTEASTPSRTRWAAAKGVLSTSRVAAPVASISLR